MSAAPIDWPSLLRSGLGSLRLTPDQFWDLTPFEFMLLRGDPPMGGAAFSEQTLCALMARFPDQGGDA